MAPKGGLFDDDSDDECKSCLN